MSLAVRAFIALEIPEPAKASLLEAQNDVRRLLPPARWTRPEGWHLTLKFLGETRRDTLDRMTADLAPRLRGLGAVTVELSGGGFFPSPAKPRVAWIGGSASGEQPVVHEVESAAERAGFPAETRRWAVHLTLARLKSRWPATAVDSYLAWADALAASSFICTEAVLFESRLQPGGAVYTAIERMPLD